MQICLLSPLLAVQVFHTKAIHIYKDCIRPGIYILRKDGLKKGCALVMGGASGQEPPALFQVSKQVACHFLGLFV